MRVKHLQSIYFPCKNVPAARAFYEQVLVLPLKFADGEKWVQYEAGGASFAIGSLSEAPPAAAGAIPVFEVDDFDDDRITAAGGTVIERRDMGDHGCLLSVIDPEGNIFQLFCRERERCFDDPDAITGIFQQGTQMTTWTLSRRTVVDGVEVAYDIMGSGPPVVLVHGFPSHSFIWRHVAPRLAETHSVYLYDLPGQGLSERRDGMDVSDPRQARVLKKLLDYWKLDRPAIVLHDIGNSYGMIAYYDEGCRYERIAFVSAAMLNPCVTAATLHAQKYIEAYRTMPNWIYEQILEARIRSTTFKPIQNVARLAYMKPFQGDLGQAVWYNRVAQIDPRHTDRLERQLGPLDVPVRIIWGTDDTWIPVDQAVRLQRILGGPTLSLIEGGGHFLMEDAPEEVTRHLIDFLNEPAVAQKTATIVKR